MWNCACCSFEQKGKGNDNLKKHDGEKLENGRLEEAFEKKWRCSGDKIACDIDKIGGKIKVKDENISLVTWSEVER